MHSVTNAPLAPCEPNTDSHKTTKKKHFGCSFPTLWGRDGSERGSLKAEDLGGSQHKAERSLSLPSPSSTSPVFLPSTCLRPRHRVTWIRA